MLRSSGKASGAHRSSNFPVQGWHQRQLEAMLAPVCQLLTSRLAIPLPRTHNCITQQADHAKLRMYCFGRFYMLIQRKSNITWITMDMPSQPGEGQQVAYRLSNLQGDPNGRERPVGRCPSAPWLENSKRMHWASTRLKSVCSLWLLKATIPAWVHRRYKTLHPKHDGSCRQQTNIRPIQDGAD